MQVGDGLVLRDIHMPPAPAWWPPAPGWWIALVALLVAAGGLAWWLARRRRRARAVARLFDDALAQAATPGERVAAISGLLRRAARRIDPHADRLQGEDWLRFLDQGRAQPTLAGHGPLLLEGAFRPDVPADQVEALRIAARARFMNWMDVRA